MKIILFLFLFFISFLSWAGSIDMQSQSSSKKTDKKIQSEVGLNIPKWGVAIDAVYDSRLDNLIQGYKILNVVITNQSANVIHLEVLKDKWKIKDNLGKSHTAINHLRMAEGSLWSKLPVTLKEKLEYPHLVRIGHSSQIDLFFPDSVELSSFKEIIWSSAHFKKEFNIYSAVDNNVDTEPAQEKISDKPTYRRSMEKYEGLDDYKKNDTKKTTDLPPAFNPSLDDISIISK